jgi:hypothetical protein
MIRTKALSAFVAFSVLLAAIVLSAPIGLATASHECSAGSAAAEIVVATSTAGTNLYADGAGIDTSYVGCDVFHGDRSASDKTEINEQKTEIATRAATTAQHTDQVLTSFENQLQNTESIARSEGLAAYYRALENGSSQSAAKAEARQAVQDFYQVKSEQLFASWNTMAAEFDNYDSLEPGYEDSFVSAVYSDGSSKEVDNFVEGNVSNPGPNGSTLTAINIPHGSSTEHTPFTSSREDEELWAGVTNNTYSSSKIELDRFEDAYNEIQTQNSDVVNEIETYVDNTYGSYQAGKIDTTDIIDANTLAREFSPNKSFQSWATVRLTQMQGVDPPENLDQVGYFEVSNQSNYWEGLLLSDESPSNGFQANSTYYTSNLTGPQYVVTEDGFTEIQGEFSIGNITKSGGERIQNVSYRNVTYNVTDTSEYQNLLNESQQLRAELDARQSALAGGGGFGDIGGKGIAIGILVLGVVFLLGRDTGDN